MIDCSIQDDQCTTWERRISRWLFTMKMSKKMARPGVYRSLRKTNVPGTLGSIYKSCPVLAAQVWLDAMVYSCWQFLLHPVVDDSGSKGFRQQLRKLIKSRFIYFASIHQHRNRWLSMSFIDGLYLLCNIFQIVFQFTGWACSVTRSRVLSKQCQEMMVAIQRENRRFPNCSPIMSVQKLSHILTHNLNKIRTVEIDIHLFQWLDILGDVWHSQFPGQFFKHLVIQTYVPYPGVKHCEMKIFSS